MIRVIYQLDENRQAEGELDLDPSTERALLGATDQERREILEPLILDAARNQDDWVMRTTVEFGLVDPDRD